MLKGLRRRVRRFNFALGVGAIAVGGTLSGIAKACDSVEFTKDLALQQAAHMRKSDGEMVEAFVVLLDFTHAIGHMARSRWDKTAYKNVMSQFKKAMTAHPDGPST